MSVSNCLGFNTSTAESFIYIRNRSGPNVEPWGTHTSTSAKEEACLLSTTLCYLFLEKLILHRILKVHWRRMLYLRLPIDSVGHCIRYANIKVFSQPNFPTYGQNPRTYMGKYVSGKSHIFPYFTQSDIFHWLAQKITHHWTRIIDIILKINNWKEVFSSRFC